MREHDDSGRSRQVVALRDGVELNRLARADQALFAAVMEAYLHGVSTRKVDDLVKALGAEPALARVSSRICADLDTEVGAFRDRTGGAKCSGSPSVTAKTARSGPRSCAHSKRGAGAGYSWSSLKPTPDSNAITAVLLGARRGNRCRVHFLRNDEWQTTDRRYLSKTTMDKLAGLPTPRELATPELITA
jgi:hypothetical protein